MTTQVSKARRVAVGSFHVRSKADAAVIALKQLGFTNQEIGIVARRTDEWEDVTTIGDGSEILSSSTMAHQIGGLWTLGLAGVVMPVAGLVVVGGVLGSILATPWAGTAVGGIPGALVGMGLSEDDANHCFDAVVDGRTIVVVRADNRYDDAVATLEDYGANVSTAVI